MATRRRVPAPCIRRASARPGPARLGSAMTRYRGSSGSASTRSVCRRPGPGSRCRSTAATASRSYATRWATWKSCTRSRHVAGRSRGIRRPPAPGSGGSTRRGTCTGRARTPHGKVLVAAVGGRADDYVDAADPRGFLVGGARGCGGHDEQGDEQRAQDVWRAEARGHRGPVWCDWTGAGGGCRRRGIASRDAPVPGSASLSVC